jgi:tetratricopeptide (TPR) repeat protein
MKRYLFKTAQVVIVLVSVSIIFMSCQREVFSEVYTDGLIALNEKNYDEALVYLSRAIELEPSFSDEYYLRAKTYYRLENYEDAISDYTKCINYDPNNAEAHYWRGIVYFYLEDYSSAILDFSSAIELDPDNGDYYYKRGSMYYLRDKGDDISKSIQDLKMGCELGDSFSCEELKNF